MRSNVFAVAGVDALRRIAEMEAFALFQAGDFSQHRAADFLRDTGKDRRFVDDDCARLQHLADGARGGDQRPQVRLAVLVDRRRHRDDEYRAIAKVFQAARQAQRSLAKAVWRNFPGRVPAIFQVFDPRVVDIETDDPGVFVGQGHGDRQADIAQPYHCNFSLTNLFLRHFEQLTQRDRQCQLKS